MLAGCKGLQWPSPETGGAPLILHAAGSGGSGWEGGQRFATRGRIPGDVGAGDGVFFFFFGGRWDMVLRKNGGPRSK